MEMNSWIVTRPPNLEHRNQKRHPNHPTVPGVLELSLTTRPNVVVTQRAAPDPGGLEISWRMIRICTPWIYHGKNRMGQNMSKCFISQKCDAVRCLLNKINSWVWCFDPYLDQPSTNHLLQIVAQTAVMAIGFTLCRSIADACWFLLCESMANHMYVLICIRICI